MFISFRMETVLPLRTAWIADILSEASLRNVHRQRCWKRGTSPRMPNTLGKIFTHAQLLAFKNRNSWAGLGAASVLIDQHVRSEPRPDLSSQRCSVANCGWNYCWWINWQRRLESWSSSSSLQKRLVCKNGHSLVEPPSRDFYTVSVSACLFVGERFFQKVYRRPLPSTSPFTLFAR